MWLLPARWLERFFHLVYECLAPKNGREAVELQQIEHADCILMDLQMLEMDGIEATTTIRIQEKESHKTRSAYIAALTANIVPADRQRCFDVGMNHYLSRCSGGYSSRRTPQ